MVSDGHQGTCKNDIISEHVSAAVAFVFLEELEFLCH